MMIPKHYPQLSEINSLRLAYGEPPPSKREAISGSLFEGGVLKLWIVDSEIMIEDLYEKCFTAKESLILAIEDKENGQFCGLAEFYGFNDSLHKVCVGYRLCRHSWGKGIATAVVGLMVEYLLSQTDIEIITASTMPENHASESVLEKNGFICTAHSVPEDWGYETLTAADKWFR